MRFDVYVQHDYGGKWVSRYHESGLQTKLVLCFATSIYIYLDILFLKMTCRKREFQAADGMNANMHPTKL